MIRPLLQAAGCLLLLLAGAAHAAPPVHDRSIKPTNPHDTLLGSEDAWSVSKTEIGCFLLSPHWVTADWGASSRFAIGHDAKLGLGLFAISFPFAVESANTKLPVQVTVDGRDLSLFGRMVDTDLMYIALDPAGEAAALDEVQGSGALSITLQDTSILHSGQAAAKAVEEYRKTCGAAGG